MGCLPQEQSKTRPGNRVHGSRLFKCRSIWLAKRLAVASLAEGIIREAYYLTVIMQLLYMSVTRIGLLFPCFPLYCGCLYLPSPPKRKTDCHISFASEENDVRQVFLPSSSLAPSHQKFRQSSTRTPSDRLPKLSKNCENIARSKLLSKKQTG